MWNIRLVRIIIALILSTVLIVIGAIMISSARPLAVYKNEKVYNQEQQRLYAKVDATLDKSSTVDETALNHLTDEWYDLRDASLTPKYSLTDHGSTFIELGAGLFLTVLAYTLLSRTQRGRLYSPSKAYFYILANVLVVSLCIASTISVFVDYNRGTNPYWADSLGIPLIGTVIMFFFLVPACNVLLGLAMTIKYKKALPLSLRRKAHPSRKRSHYYTGLAIIVASLAIVVTSIVNGDYASVLPALFLSAILTVRIATVRQKPVPTKRVPSSPSSP